MNNQPVAYMCPKGFVYGLHETRPVEANIPLQVVRNPTLVGGFDAPTSKMQLKAVEVNKTMRKHQQNDY